MNIHIITIFPKFFDSIINEGMVYRAILKNKINIFVHNLRDYTNDKYQSVDDHPYGGGPGMVMKIEPIYKAVNKIKKELKGSTLTLLTSAKGKMYNQGKVNEYKGYDNLIIICGHYEGVDERVNKYIADEEISIGEYVLSGGEIPAFVIVDSIARTIDGVLGNNSSLEFESHNTKGILEYPQYTKPEIFELENGIKANVPPVLLSGNHKEINKWKEDNLIKSL